MTGDDPQPQREPQATGPEAPPRRWSGRRAVAAVAVAVGVAAAGGAALAGGAVAAGATGVSSPGHADAAGADEQRAWRHGPGRALHGEFVVSDGAGGHVTRLSQRGKVTAVTDTSITVVSDDGYSATYTITDTTKRPDEIAVDATVVVVADDAKAALVIRDPAQRPEGRGGPGRGHHRGDDAGPPPGAGTGPETSAPTPTT